jgi:hypothetical protein
MLGLLCLAGSFTDETTNRGLEIFWRTGLGQDEVAACSPRAIGIGCKRRIAGNSKNWNVSSPSIVFEAPSQLEAINSRNVEIGYDHMRPGIECPLQRLESVMCLLDAEPSLRQPFGVQTPTVLIILDEEHNRARFGRSHWRVPGPSICAAGSGDQKFADSGLQQREAILGLMRSGLLSLSRFSSEIFISPLQSMFLFRRCDDRDSIALGGDSQSCDVTKSERAEVGDSRPTGDAATPSIKNRVHGTERGAIRSTVRLSINPNIRRA